MYKTGKEQQFFDAQSYKPLFYIDPRNQGKTNHVEVQCTTKEARSAKQTW